METPAVKELSSRRLKKAAHYLSECGFNSYTKNASDIQQIYVECLEAGNSIEKAMNMAVTSCCVNQGAPELVQICALAISAPVRKKIADFFDVLGTLGSFILVVSLAVYLLQQLDSFIK